MIRAALIALPLAALASAVGATPISPGVYGNVSYSAGTGDLGGIELQLTGVGDAARVEFVFCEGWCSASHFAPVHLSEGGFSFDYAEQYFDEDGQPLPPVRMHVEARSAGNGLSVTVSPATKGARAVTMKLSRLKARYGLAVADRD